MLKISGILLTCFAIAALTLMNCSFDKPKAPSWELELKIPLTSKKYVMSELADDSENLYAEGNDFGILIEGDFDSVYVGDNLKIESVYEKASFELGVFEIAAADTQADSSLSLARFWAPATQHIGNSVPVPSFAFIVAGDDAPSYDFDDFLVIKIDSGAADMKIINQFKIPLGLPLILTLKDGYTNQTLSTIDFKQPIPADTAVTVQFPIRDKVFSNKLYIEFRGQSPGSNGVPVFMDMSQRILILELSISDLYATYAKARVPEIHFSKTEQVELTREMIITEAKFKSGHFKLNVYNYLPIGTHFNLTFLDLFDQNDQVFTMQLDMDKNSELENEEIDLSGWKIKTNSDPSVLVQRLRINYAGYTESSEINLVELSKNDSIAVDTYLEDVSFEYVKGAINRLEVEMDEVEQDIDLKYKLKDLRIKNASLQLEVHNRVAFPIELDMTMTGSRKTGQQQHYSLRETIEPAVMVEGQEQPIERVTSVLIDDTHNQYNSFMNFINLIPEKIAIGGKVFIGQLGVEGMVHREDYVLGKYTVKAPFELSFSDTTINFDTVFVNINPPDFDTEKPDSVEEQIDAEITNDLSDATIWLALENHLPVAVEVLVRMDTSMANVFGAGASAVNKSFHLSAAPTGENGIVTVSVMDTISIKLDRDEFNLFKNNSSPPEIRTVVIGTQLHLPGTDGKTIVVQADDFIAIRQSYIRFGYLIDNN